MSQNEQTHFKNLKVCLTILGHYALKVKSDMNKLR